MEHDNSELIEVLWNKYRGAFSAFSARLGSAQVWTDGVGWDLELQKRRDRIERAMKALEEVELLFHDDYYQGLYEEVMSPRHAASVSIWA